MADTAAHLVDAVLPAVPIRQWVLTVPFPLRYRLAYDRKLMTPVLAAFLRAVFASQRRRARDRRGVQRAKTGAVTFVQRFGGALNLNVHFHSLVIDGVYEVLSDSAGVRFVNLPAPDLPEVARVLADAVERIRAALGRCAFEDDQDELARDNPVLAALYAAAVEGRNATGTEAGRRTARVGREGLAVDPALAGSSLCAVLGGFSLHAGVFVRASDRLGLERICRYMGRPALASERLDQLPDGRLLYRLRHRWRDGSSAIVLEPRELLARLAAQVPPPGAHQVRYHGVLAPACAWRRYVVPASSQTGNGADWQRGCSNVPRWKRMAWSDLLRRVFAVDALVCNRCGGRMRVMAAMRSPQAVSRFLDSVGAGRSPPARQTDPRAK
jgi:hypothetical protein